MKSLPLGGDYDAEKHTDVNREREVPICFGGVVMGKLTNKAMIYKYNLTFDADTKEVSHGETGEEWIADHHYDLPLPMMHHSALSTGKSIYLFGGKIPIESQLNG